MHGMYDPKWKSYEIQGLADIGHKLWGNVRWGYYYNVSKHYFELYDHIIQLHQFDPSYNFFKNKYNIQSEVIENAAENVFFLNDRSSDNMISGKYALSVANYIPRKNQELLLKSFYRLENEADFRMIFIGSEKSDYYQYLVRLNKKLSKKYGDRNIELLYGIGREQTISYIKNASFFLLGSKWEAFPLSIVESMASGVPFISMDVGCVRFLPGGRVVNDEEEMAYWMSLLIENESIRKMLGDAGREYAKEHMSIASQIHKLEELLE
jgi:glycosyltransferase involved in cell wall biosynthesis